MSRLAFGGQGAAPGSGALSFLTLPELEANVGVDDYVCNFVGGLAQNEVGVAGANLGISGADLVLTQTGSVPAAVDGWRSLTGPQAFTLTAGLLNSVCTSPVGFSILWHLKNFENPEVQQFLFAIQADGAPGGSPYIYSFSQRFSCGIGGSTVYNSSGVVTPINNIPENGEGYLLLSYDPTVEFVFLGLSAGESQPTKAGDFHTYSLGFSPAEPAVAATGFMGSNNSIIGYRLGTTSTISIASVTMSAYPSVTFI